MLFAAGQRQPVQRSSGPTCLKPGPHREPVTGNQFGTSNQPEAHHIVAGGAGGSAASRQILAEEPVCIGINDAVNGVWLPKTSGVNVTQSSNRQGRIFHNQTFEANYNAYVYCLLNDPNVRGNNAAVVKVLVRIRGELVGGKKNW